MIAGEGGRDGRRCRVRGGGDRLGGWEGGTSGCRGDCRGGGGQGHLALSLTQSGGVVVGQGAIVVSVWCAESFHDQLLCLRH